MKTFDEAIRKIVLNRNETSDSKIIADLKAADSEEKCYLELIKACVLSLSTMVLMEQRLAPEGLGLSVDTIVKIHSALHRLFQVGVLTGIEMEKPNEQDNSTLYKQE